MFDHAREQGWVQPKKPTLVREALSLYPTRYEVAYMSTGSLAPRTSVLMPPRPFRSVRHPRRAAPAQPFLRVRPPAGW